MIKNKSTNNILLVIVFLAVIGVGVYLSYNRPLKEPSNTDNSNSSEIPFGWKTFSDSQSGTIFKYPESIPTEYMHVQVWPPTIIFLEGEFSCIEREEPGDGPIATTIKKIINGHEYCITSSNEGAAGSIYTDYSYKTLIQGKLIDLGFEIRAVQCGNYDEPQKTTCETERATFDIDSLVGQIVETINFVK